MEFRRVLFRSVLLAARPIVFHDGVMTCCVFWLTGTTKSKLWAERVLRISWKLHRGLGVAQKPVNVPPVGLKQTLPLAQSESTVQAVVVTFKLHSESCENSCELIC